MSLLSVCSTASPSLPAAIHVQREAIVKRRRARNQLLILAPIPGDSYNRSMRRKGRGPLPLSEVLQERLHALGWEGKMEEMQILKRWEEAVGPQIARRTSPSHVKDHRLTVIVDSSVWAQQLALMKKELLTRFDLLLGKGVIRDLYLVTGKVESPPAPEEPEEVQRLPLDDETRLKIEEEASRIPDRDLREAFRRTLRAASRRKPSRR